MSQASPIKRRKSRQIMVALCQWVVTPDQCSKYD